MKLLIADDDKVSRAMLHGMLTRWGYEVVLAANGGEAWDALNASDAPRLAILDWMMPGKDGLEICRAVRERQSDHYIYIVLVTAKAHKDDIIQALEAGADDYLVKPFEPLELKARLFSGRRILLLQEELIAAREAMRHLASRDFVTNTWNRRAIMEFLDRELVRAEREGRPLGVLMSDIDYFKRVNDTYGHAAGDAVLKETAQRISASLRPYDAVGRYGGEDFVVVIPGATLDITKNLAERLRHRIHEAPVVTDEHSVPVTISVGVASYGGHGAVVPQRLLDDADQALYRAKSDGRNRVVSAS